MKETANSVRIVYGTDGQWSGAKLYIRDGSEDSEIIAETVLDGQIWERTEIEVPLTKKLEPGTYTFYACFGGDGKCTDLYRIEFYNAEEATE